MAKAPWQDWHRGEYYSNPWWKGLLSENSPPYEDNKPTHIRYRLDPLKPSKCPHCGALQVRKEDTDIMCFMCGWRDPFALDTMIIGKIAKFWDWIACGNTEELLTNTEENKLKRQRAERKIYVSNHYGEVLRQNRGWRANNREKARERDKQYRELYREQRTAYEREYRKRRKELRATA